MYDDLKELKNRFSGELLQIWNYYQPKIIEVVFDKFKAEIESRHVLKMKEQQEAINIQNEIIRSLETRIESLEKSMGGVRP